LCVIYFAIVIQVTVYEWCPVDHVQEVGAGRVVAVTEVTVAVPVVAGHAVVPAVMLRGVPVDRHQSHVRQNVDHVLRKKRRSVLMKTTAAGAPVRSAILKLLAAELLFKANCPLASCLRHHFTVVGVQY